ncbi:hypothetical protein [Nitrosomonas sp. H1_AOB3]|uniref:hypothetical protein n=1 Tax=Nitrosomonas sp. H1_AOB3 TaxID=2741553 RepID=UPI0019359400|nr:hypothetical protein [Nitrosomonas sp. H1_AOB3]QOJ10005.1 MAG: hypothetical protein HRU73_11475 [Nitrosomonas sp. H1_AOB3]
MKWAIEVQKTSLEQRNLADLLKGLGFDLIQENECPALSSPTIDACATAADAFEIAKDVRAAFKGPANIDPEFALGSVIDYATTPPRRHVFLEGASCVMKNTCGTGAITISPPKELSSDELSKWHEEHNELEYQATLERQRVLLEPAFLDPKAAKVIELLCIENPSGETLYKIYEFAEGHHNNRSAFHDEIGINEEQFNRFKDAVHNPAVTGDWARHGIPRELNSTDPMTPTEAEQFVRRIAEKWLQSIRRSK